MTNSVYVQNAQRITTAIQQAFVDHKLDRLPLLSMEYGQALVELIQADGHWAVHTDPSISLQAVCKSVLNQKTQEGYIVVGHDTKQDYLAAMIDTLPVTIDTAARLISLPACPVDKLVNKLIKTYFSYPVDHAGLIDLLTTISTKSKTQCERLLVDILVGKSTFSNPSDLIASGALMHLVAKQDQPSTALKDAIKGREADFLACINMGDPKDRLKALQGVVKMSVRAFTNLKLAGCDASVAMLLNIGSVDYKTETKYSSFFEAGGKLPASFISKSITSASYQFDMKFALVEALTVSDESFINAIKSLPIDNYNSLAEYWFKCLGDAITTARQEGQNPSREAVVALIDTLAWRIDNKQILRGSTLASGIDGRFLAHSPSLKEFRGDYIHQDLGL